MGEVEGEGVGGTNRELRRIGAALSGIGVPWILTIFGASGISFGNGVWIVPLLWFAPPFIFVRLWKTAQCFNGAASMVWWATLGVGVSAWAVAVPASLLGAERAFRGAHSIGLALGALLFCTAMVALTSRIGWPRHEQTWRNARRTVLAAEALMVAAGLLAGLQDRRVDPSSVDLTVPAVLLGLASAVVGIIAWVQMARALRATRRGLLLAPEHLVADAPPGTV